MRRCRVGSRVAFAAVAGLNTVVTAVTFPTRGGWAGPAAAHQSSVQPRIAFLTLVSAVSHAFAGASLPCSTLMTALINSVPMVASSGPI